MLIKRDHARSRHPAAPVLPVDVLIDGSALYLAARNLGDGQPLDYRALVAVLCENVPGLQAPWGNQEAEPSHWVMWTSASAENAGQNRFLDFAADELMWTVRRVSPSDSFMVDPSAALGLVNDPRTSRLVRFDSQIAFAMGRLAEKSKLLVISDSFPLAASLQRAKQLRPEPQNNALAFFGHALDPRWQRLLREREKYGIDFLDLDDFSAALFGRGKEVSQGGDKLPF
jgi:hypothetical protein